MNTLKKNDQIDLEITGMTSEGNGVGRHEDFVIFVPMTAVGDRIRCHIVKVNKHFAYGKIDTLLDASPARIQNDCEMYQQCGGCCYRHMEYAAEQKIKEEFVAQNLKKIAGITLPLEPILSCNPDRYRNKAQYPIGIDQNGNVILGFYARHSHRIIDCKDCKLQPKLFSQICQIVKDWITAYQISVYDEKTGTGLLRHLYLRMAQKTDQLMVCLVSTKAQVPHLNELTERLTGQFDCLTSLILNVNPKNTNVILGKKCTTVYGADSIEDEICGIKIRISPLAFYQVNRDAAEQMYLLAAKYAQLNEDDLLLDLYCGTGTIGLTMAHEVKQLIGVEVIEEAVQNAKRNAKNAGIAHADFICADAGQAATKLKEQGLHPTVVVVDPPRKGCDEITLNAIIEMSPDRLVYISCNCATLARDIAYLQQHGYVLNKARPVDLFPRTHHVECVSLLMKD